VRASVEALKQATLYNAEPSVRSNSEGFSRGIETGLSPPPRLKSGKENKVKQIVEVRDFGDRRYKQWARLLTSVDRSKSDGYAFQGEFLALGRKHELEVGSLVLYYGEAGSRNNHCPCVRVQRVEADGGLSTIYQKMDLGRNWVLDVRDEIAELIAELLLPAAPAPANPEDITRVIHSLELYILASGNK
jgi:hypothetical protein